MKGRLDAAFMRPEPHSGALVYKRMRSEPLIVVLPRGHRLAARKAIPLRDLRDEPFIKPSKTAPTLRKIIEDALRRAGLDLRATHEVHNLAHAFSMVASTGAVTLLPQYARNYLPSSVVGRPIRGQAPTVDLVVGYNKANTSQLLKLFVSKMDGLSAITKRA
jgi:LysR family hca operon transcriptional activator